VGVSILMTPGPVGRNHGKQLNITPGFRSAAATALRTYFGEAPFTIVEADLSTLEMLACGASVYVMEAKENMWAQIADAVREHSAVTIVMEY
jgi:hypothetical protein